MNDDHTPDRLEQGTALSLLWDTADDLRQTVRELSDAIEDHAMTTYAFLRAAAGGAIPDPSGLLRSRGRVEALLALLTGHAEQEGATLAELRIGVLANEENPPELEARAWAAFRARVGRAERASEEGQRLPEDPRAETLAEV